MIGVWLALATLLRQNGILLAALLLIILIVTLPGLRAPAALCLVGVLLVVATAKLVVYPIVGIAPTPTQATLAIELHDLAWIFGHDPAAFTQDDRALLVTVAPLDKWRHATDQYDCYNANWEFDPAFHWKRLDGHALEWHELWFQILLRRPDTVVNTRLCSGSIAWNTREVGPQFTVERGIIANRWGLETTPLSSWLHQKALAVIVRMDEPGNELWAWRAPRWIYLADAAVLFAAIRRRRALLLLAALPLLAQQFSVGVLSPAQDARYMLASLILALLLLPIVFVRDPGQPDPAPPDHEPADHEPGVASTVAEEDSLTMASSGDA
jgi:hypothetical protein